MKVTEIAFKVAEIAVVELDDGMSTIAVLTHGAVRGSKLSDCGTLFDLAVNSAAEECQNEFEERLLKYFMENIKDRSETIVNGKIGEELE